MCHDFTDLCLIVLPVHLYICAWGVGPCGSPAPSATLNPEQSARRSVNASTVRLFARCLLCPHAVPWSSCPPLVQQTPHEGDRIHGVFCCRVHNGEGGYNFSSNSKLIPLLGNWWWLQFCHDEGGEVILLFSTLSLSGPPTLRATNQPQAQALTDADTASG